MKTISITLDCEIQTAAVAAQFAECIEAPLVLGLSGSLGAGKTTFVRAMLRKLGILGAIKSPTYALMESYSCAKFTLHHFDLYRIASDDELELLGFRDCLNENTVCCIEWPDNAQLSQKSIDLQLYLHLNAEGRTLLIEAKNARGKQWLTTLAEQI